MKRVLMLASAVLAAGVGVGAVGVAVASVAAGSVAAGSVAARHGAKIVAKPDSVMVNKATTLTGTGFKRHKKFTIWECSATNWIVPQQICNHHNAVRVRANARGDFKIKIKALVCPVASPPLRLAGPIKPPGPVSPVSPAGFSRHCFLGVPKPRGVDVVVLSPSTRITVTGP